MLLCYSGIISLWWLKWFDSSELKTALFRWPWFDKIVSVAHDPSVKYRALHALTVCLNDPFSVMVGIFKTALLSYNLILLEAFWKSDEITACLMQIYFCWSNIVVANYVVIVINKFEKRKYLLHFYRPEHIITLFLDYLEIMSQYDHGEPNKLLFLVLMPTWIVCFFKNCFLLF